MTQIINFSARIGASQRGYLAGVAPAGPRDVPSVSGSHHGWKGDMDHAVWKTVRAPWGAALDDGPGASVQAIDLSVWEEWSM
jgi:hypothetical protein